MARPFLLSALAATVLALAAFSAQAGEQHQPAAPPQPISSPKQRDPHKHKHHGAAPSPLHGEGPVIRQEPYPGFYKLVERCLLKLREECGHEIFHTIFGDDDEVSDKCCVELVEVGRRCHRNILKATLTLPELSNRDKKMIKRRDVEVWSRCVLVNDDIKHGNLSCSSP